jgi:hypothetical protein
MSFGGQSVTIRTYADGATRDRFNKPEHQTTPWSRAC